MPLWWARVLLNEEVNCLKSFDLRNDVEWMVKKVQCCYES